MMLFDHARLQLGRKTSLLKALLEVQKNSTRLVLSEQDVRAHCFAGLRQLLLLNNVLVVVLLVAEVVMVNQL
jgi:hypothetical protein